MENIDGNILEALNLCFLYNLFYSQVKKGSLRLCSNLVEQKQASPASGLLWWL